MNMSTKLKGTAKKTYPVIHPMHFLTDEVEIESIDYAKRIYLRDVEGKVYLDTLSGSWNVPLGYSQNEIKEVINTQLNQIPYINYKENSNPTILSLADKLLEITHSSFAKVSLMASGSDGIEAALKLARKYYHLQNRPEKNQFIAFDYSYHGTTFGAMSASNTTAIPRKHYEPKVSGFISIPHPHFANHEGGTSEEQLERNIEYLGNIFVQEADRTAAIILEPVAGAGGILPIPEAYLKKIRELCDRHDVLYIFDEVATGFHRTGNMFAFQSADVVPDILCLGKAINNGYLPLAAMLFNEKILQVLKDNNGFIDHGTTQNGNPVACASALKAIELYEREDYNQINTQLSEEFFSQLHHRLHDHKYIAEIRGKGMMIGISLVNDRKSNTPWNFPQILFLKRILKKVGLITGFIFSPPYSTGILLMPPFVMNEKEVRQAVDRIVIALEHYEKVVEKGES